MQGHTTGTGRWRSKGSHLYVGVDWVMRGVAGSESGVDMVLASRAEQVWGLDRSLRLFKEDFEESGIAVEFGENDVVTAGLLRAGILAGRRVAALFEMRGLRQAMDVLYEASRVVISGQGAGLVIACESHGSGPRNWNSRGTSGKGVRDPERTVVRGKPGLVHDVPADARELAVYLGLPVILPGSAGEIEEYVNEGLRLSRTARTLVMMWLTPTLVGSGETEHGGHDGSVRAAPPGELRPDDTSTPFHLEVRRRELSRLLNPPVQGEEVPLAFITIGTAHTSLRHALSILGQSGKFPILKMAHVNPADRRAIEQFLLRCKRVIVVEGGRSILEQNIHGIARELTRANHVNVAEVYGKLLPGAAAANAEGTASAAGGDDGRHLTLGQRRLATMIGRMGWNPAGAAMGLPWSTDLHPSELALRLGPVLRALRQGDQRMLEARLAAAESDADASLEVRLQRRARGRGDESLVRLLVNSAMEDLREELSQAAADRRAIQLEVESIDTAPLEEQEGRRTVVELERRRLASVGRAAISHAIRRRLSMTFLVLPDSAEKAQRLDTAEADRLVRGVIREAETSVATVTTLDPSDGPAFRHALKNEVLFAGVSVVIIDTEQARSAAPVAGPAEEWAHLGFAPIQAWVRAGGASCTLGYEWLLRRGWDNPSVLDGVRGPKLERPIEGDWRRTALDGWDHFEEIRLARSRAPRETARWFEEATLPDPEYRHGKDPTWRAHVCGPSGPAMDLAVLLMEQAGQRMGYRVQLLRGRDGSGSFAQFVFTRPAAGEQPMPITARTPYGGADVILALDKSSLAEAMDEEGGHRVACAGRTSALLDNSPSLAEALLAEDGGSTGREGDEELARLLQPGGLLHVQAAEMSGQLLNGRDLAGVVLVGTAFQRGLIPVSWESLHRASQRISGDSLNQVPTALRLGRGLALRETGEILGEKPARMPTARQMVRMHERIMRSRRKFGSRRRAAEFRTEATATLEVMPGLRRADPSGDTERMLTLRLVDCEVWGGIATCREYARRIAAIYKAESEGNEYRVTRKAIQELAWGMLYADPVFVAATVARPDRLREEERRRGCRRTAEDRLTVRVRMRVGPPVAANFGLGPLAGVYIGLSTRWCAVLGECRFLRHWPWWSRREKQYRQQSIDLMERCARSLPGRESVWQEILGQMGQVRGCEPRRLALIRRSRVAIASLLELSGESM